MPLLLEGLALMSKERPPNPVEWLATYLMQHKDDDLTGLCRISHSPSPPPPLHNPLCTLSHGHQAYVTA